MSATIRCPLQSHRRIVPIGFILLPSGPTNAADDGTAATAGIPVGALYRNGSSAMIRVS